MPRIHLGVRTIARLTFKCEAMRLEQPDVYDRIVNVLNVLSVGGKRRTHPRDLTLIDFVD